MRLPDEVQKCVVFLGLRRTDPKTGIERVVYGGTGFLIAVPSSFEGASFICLVTARHVAEKLEHGEFYIRANDRNGEGREIVVDGGVDLKWYFHPTDESVDVAVAIWVPPTEIDFLFVPHHMFLDVNKMRHKGIGVGDEVYVTGLFRMMHGTKRNFPIVRTGNIAMLPNERVPVSKWHTPDIEAYLIEARSIGGLSGSPVFAQRSIKVQAVEPTGRTPVAAGAVFLIGLVHGHWNLPENEVDYEADENLWGRRERINVGIAMVVPAHKILEVLDHPELVERMHQAHMWVYNNPTNVLDGGSPPSVRRGLEELTTRELTVSASATATEGIVKG